MFGLFLRKLPLVVPARAWSREEDATSKFRRTLDGWRDKDLNGSQLQLAAIPGIISKLQGFRGTACKVREFNRPRDLLEGEASAAYHLASHARPALLHEVKTALDELHWKDFEILVDLLFGKLAGDD
jgi:hypothetical protein